VRSSLILPCFSLALLACGEDDSGGFIALDKACVGYAETVCAGRERCCDDPGSLDDCELRVLEACEPQRQALTGQAGLRYDGEAARQALDDIDLALDTCGGAPPVSRLFEGGKRVGEACTTAAECASYACDGVCLGESFADLCAL
jgi:hypothetical protein